MNTIKVSATKARNNFFSLLEQVASGMEIVIEKDRKEIAVLKPKKQTVDWKGLLKASKAAHGILKDDDPNDNPLRRPGAKNFLGRWDKDLPLRKVKKK